MLAGLFFLATVLSTNALSPVIAAEPQTPSKPFVRSLIQCASREQLCPVSRGSDDFQASSYILHPKKKKNWLSADELLLYSILQLVRRYHECQYLWWMRHHWRWPGLHNRTRYIHAWLHQKRAMYGLPVSKYSHIHRLCELMCGHVDGRKAE